MLDPEQLQLDTVYALARTDRYLYAARKSGLYRSADDGATWETAFASLAVTDTVTVTALITHGNTIFVGATGAILRSDDDGEYWHVALLTSPPPVVVALAISPAYADDGVLAAATAEDGVFVSTDRGESWVPWNFGLIDLNIHAIAISPAFSSDRTIIAGTESGMFRSKNGGRSWHELAFSMDVAPVVSLGLSPSYATDGVLYAGTAEHGLYISDDFGVQWRQLQALEASVNAITILDQTMWLLLDNQIVYSHDGGRSWSQAGTPFVDGKLAMTMLLPADPSVALLVGMANGEILAVPFSA